MTAGSPSASVGSGSPRSRPDGDRGHTSVRSDWELGADSSVRQLGVVLQEAQKERGFPEGLISCRVGSHSDATRQFRCTS